jgi:23S rRNA (pseudouridine1915-N3)-methyltransferase
VKCRLIAAGTRLPEWVGAGFRDYQRRLRRPMTLDLVEIPVAPRRAGEPVRAAITREGGAMLAAVCAGDYVVALDVAGKAMSTATLAAWLARRMQDGRPLALLVGGPDGLASTCLARAELRWSLSPLTFPHALVRVMVAEQLYRATSLLAHHPYHRA